MVRAIHSQELYGRYERLYTTVTTAGLHQHGHEVQAIDTDRAERREPGSDPR